MRRGSLKYRIHPDALANRIGNQIVVVHLHTDRIFELNETGSRIWELLAEGRNRLEIENLLKEEFQITESLITNEIDQLLASLTAESLITVEDDC
jgi:hypothetical protein